MSIFGLLVSIVGLGLLIFVHELGHFASGKLLKLKITEFFLGLPFGRPLIEFRRGETVYGVKPVLFGGYVKFPEFLELNEVKIGKIAPGSPAAAAGLKNNDVILEIDGMPISTWLEAFDVISGLAGSEVTLKINRNEADLILSAAIGTRNERGWLGAGPASTDEVTIEDLPETLEGQTIWRKGLVVAAGPLMNIALALFLVTGAMMIGFAEPTTTIGRVLPGGPAETVGIKAGDKIVRVAGTSTGNWQKVITTIRKNAGRQVTIIVLREGRRLKFTTTLREKSEQGLLGVVTKLVRRARGPLEAGKEGSIFVYQAGGMIIKFMGQLVTNPKIVVGQLRSPIGVVQETAPIAQRDILEYVINLAGISIAIGIFNLLPIPPLDGGRIFISGIEFIRRRPIAKESLMFINVVGVSLLLVLMTYVIVADIFRLATPGGG